MLPHCIDKLDEYSISFILFHRNHRSLRNDFYIIRSLDHEMYLQRVQKSTQLLTDDKQCYEANESS